MSDEIEMSEALKKEETKILSSLGLCARAGKIIFGVPMICEAMKKRGAKAPCAVFEASDTSENTHKKITDKCKFYNILHNKKPLKHKTSRFK